MNQDSKHSPAVLVEVTRGPIVESVHYGAVAVADADGNLVAWAGDPSLVTYYRSACKPLQAIPLVESGGADHFGLTDAEIAIICGSHGGEAVHLETVQRILDKIGASPNDLGCGSHVPLSPDAARDLRKRGEQPSVLHSNCSGKHAGMLALARFNGWPLHDYRAPDHPVQQTMLRTIADFAGMQPSDVQIGVDGCGVCTLGISVHRMAVSFARLAQPDFWPEPRRTAVERVWRAMNAHPEMVGYAENNLDTDLMRACNGSAISKRGAEGTYCAAALSALSTQHSALNKPLGFALKLLDGDESGRARNPAIIEGLLQAGFLDEAALGKLERYRTTDVINRPGAVVGVVRAAFTLSVG